jgi:hypothetical protein
MLNDEQIKLLVHLKLYGVADLATCKFFVNDYALRPLVRYQYLHETGGIYRLLKKGQETTAHIAPLVTLSGNEDVIKRTLKTARLAALFANLGVQSAGNLRDNAFIPSNKWREIRSGIISTARFNGVLCRGGRLGSRLAVYDVGDGSMDWQAYAESSLFFRKYGKFEDQATGMLLVCDGDEIPIAEKILRFTISNRKALLKRTALESDKPRAYSFYRIRLRPYYEKVYITNAANLAETLRAAASGKKFLEYFMSSLGGCKCECSEGDVEAYPKRYFVNPQGDLLKFAEAWDAAKSSKIAQERLQQYHIAKVNYHIITIKRFERLARLYADIPLGVEIADENLFRGLV